MQSAELTGFCTLHFSLCIGFYSVLSPQSSALSLDAALFGLIVADVIGEPVDLRDPPAPGGMRLLHSITFTTGGNVCNTGVAMAKLGMRAAAAGLVGNDVLG